ncbi:MULTISPECIES: hypothetical protein [Paenibacillus]|uniref:Uncharacterized protein n=1 Tax=Paenibacillus taichungensis TaxID=484184 RepID=A0ABX2MI79_9BACL|nr:MULTISPECIES: hypothetical protein [Paenibacillus]NUU54086.1 hypothetical protein [Paenibacillus taichungensis]SLJ97996.1 hypothetical protein SAMN06272722_102680 [Paenibacillus sp. RU5A]SOC66835.1 hypothetical protein SAMN05880581_102317 [Paenibacillus sp. RU26A]SOC70016.1 hypothetical protein SAMN05880586_102680 [Paenibacillus sp. RU5M]
MDKTSEDHTAIVDILKASLPRKEADKMYREITYLSDKKLTVKIKK